MTEQDYFEQFTGEEIPQLIVFSGIKFTPDQAEEFKKLWEDYMKTHPDWWRHQVITVESPCK